MPVVCLGSLVMNLSAPFIRRPVATLLLSLAILLLGGVSFGLLPVAPLHRGRISALVTWR